VINSPFDQYLSAVMGEKHNFPPLCPTSVAFHRYHCSLSMLTGW